MDLFFHNSSQDESNLYLNQGDFKFVDAISEANISSKGKPSMGVILFDLDYDNNLDLYCTYDGSIPNKFYLNDGLARFKDVSDSLGLNLVGDCMGVDIADFNRDGRIDIYISNLYPNSLMVQQSDGTFVDHAEECQVNDPGMGWGTTCFDYNNDSFTDILAVNSIYPNGSKDFLNKLYRNNGDNTFTNVESGSALEPFKNSFGCSVSDLNLDGKMDIVIANGGGDGVQIFKNEEPHGNWILLTFVAKEKNLFAIGTKVRTWSNGILQMEEIHAGSGYAAQNGYNLHFGLGQANLIDSMQIIWPDGSVQHVDTLEANRRYFLFQENDPEIFEIKKYQRALCQNSSRDECSLQPIEKEVLSVDEHLGLMVFPNPVREHLNVNWKYREVSKISIYNLSGKRMLSSTGTDLKALSSPKIDMTNFKTGTYLLKIISGNFQFVKTIIKE